MNNSTLVVAIPDTSNINVNKLGHALSSKQFSSLEEVEDFLSDTLMLDEFSVEYLEDFFCTVCDGTTKGSTFFQVQLKDSDLVVDKQKIIDGVKERVFNADPVLAIAIGDLAGLLTAVTPHEFTYKDFEL